ncbi:MAG: hypothetical protein V1846_01640 [Candidatus Komeilibacteria bacterium]
MAAKRSYPQAEIDEETPESEQSETIRIAGRAPLDRATKIVIGALVLCGVVIVGLSVWLLQYRITHPFDVSLSDILTPTSTTTTALVATDLKNKDTDADGLTDYDEIYLYGTSPYLKDTDSDGVADGTEVQRGTDPNCDQKKGACTGMRFINPDVKMSDLLPQFSPTNITLKDATLKQFRQILLDSGMDAATLATLDDRALFAAMDAIVSYDQQEPIDVTTLDEQEIRKFLVDSGVSQSEVDRMSPEDLTNLIKTLQ